MNLNKANYARLGKALIKLHPSIAADLITSLTEHENSFTLTVTDHIPSFYATYKTTFPSQLKQDEAIQRKLVFVAAIVNLYHPQFFKPYNTDNCRRNLRVILSNVLCVNRSWLSQKLGEIPVMLKVYDDFKEAVEQTTQQIKVQYAAINNN